MSYDICMEFRDFISQCHIELNVADATGQNLAYIAFAITHFQFISLNWEQEKKTNIKKCKNLPIYV